MAPNKTSKAIVIDEAAEKAKLQSNFITQMRNNKGTEAEKKDKAEVYNLYTSLSRKDPEKALLLQKWSSDTSCKWTNQYSKERSFKVSTTDTSLQGHGTKSDLQFHWFVVCVLCCFYPNIWHL